ncbi:MAG: insulinase family protein [Treponema sp.]|nr:insulinase family protein [Treponema sp.]
MISHFTIIETVDLKEMNAKGVWAKHTSGLEVFHVLNNDEENVFAFTFATAPEDSTGVAHIIEHSVLCGSEKYPLRDAFLALAHGSLQTFLNAWTFPDKTVYPAASTNKQDYFNLMSVYGDAVFRPLLSEWTFMQEGWRLEFKDAQLAFNGVVYNEMKGAYSSMDTYADHWVIKAVTSGTPYVHDAGGDPEYIPDLTYKAFKQFHRKRYTPANCRVFLAGGIPTETQLDFLDQILSTDLAEVPNGKPTPPIPLASPFEKPAVVRVSCPLGVEEGPSALVSWLCSDVMDAEETMALICLAEILMGHDGSPLAKRLVESGLGEDMSPASGFADYLRQTVFAVGLRRIKTSAQDVETLIFDELRRLVRDRIRREDIESALLSLEFSHRELKRPGGPIALAWLQRALNGWLHGAKPWETMLFMPRFEKVKANLAQNPRFFEEKIEKYLLNNQHRALVCIEPEKDFLEKKEAKLALKLGAIEVELSPKEIRAINKKNAELAKIQEEKELDIIPHLTRADLSPEIITIPRELFDAEGIPVVAHDIFTNGVSYISMAFPIDTLAPEDYLWLSLFSRAVAGVGLPGMNYAEVSGLLARTMGDFTPLARSVSFVPGVERSIATPCGVFELRGRDWLIFLLKTLDERVAESLDLAKRIIMQADFSDTHRVNDIVLNFRNDAASSLAPEGHYYAMCRASRAATKAAALDEIWNGLTQLQFINDIAKMDATDISRKLTDIRDKIADSGLIVNVTCAGGALPSCLRLIGEKCASFGPPKPVVSRDLAPFFALTGSDAERTRKPEVFASPSLQVGFAGKALTSPLYGSRAEIAGSVLAHHLSTGELWEKIRMNAGAYVVFANINALERLFTLGSYRDPAPAYSLSVFLDALKRAGKRKIDETALEKAVIGVYSKLTLPKAPSRKGFIDFERLLCGITDEQRMLNRRNLLDISADDLCSAARDLATEEGCACIIAGSAEAEKMAAKFGVGVKTLSV